MFFSHQQSDSDDSLSSKRSFTRKTSPTITSPSQYRDNKVLFGSTNSYNSINGPYGGFSSPSSPLSDEPFSSGLFGLPSIRSDTINQTSSTWGRRRDRKTFSTNSQHTNQKEDKQHQQSFEDSGNECSFSSSTIPRSHGAVHGESTNLNRTGLPTPSSANLRNSDCNPQHNVNQISIDNRENETFSSSYEPQVIYMPTVPPSKRSEYAKEKQLYDYDKFVPPPTIPPGGGGGGYNNNNGRSGSPAVPGQKIDGCTICWALVKSYGAHTRTIMEMYNDNCDIMEPEALRWMIVDYWNKYIAGIPISTWKRDIFTRALVLEQMPDKHEKQKKKGNKKKSSPTSDMNNGENTGTISTNKGKKRKRSKSREEGRLPSNIKFGAQHISENYDHTQEEENENRTKRRKQNSNHTLDEFFKVEKGTDKKREESQNNNNNNGRTTALPQQQRPPPEQVTSDDSCAKLSNSVLSSSSKPDIRQFNVKSPPHVDFDFENEEYYEESFNDTEDEKEDTNMQDSDEYEMDNNTSSPPPSPGISSSSSGASAETLPYINESMVYYHFKYCYRECNGSQIITDQIRMLTEMQHTVYVNGVFCTPSIDPMILDSNYSRDSVQSQSSITLPVLPHKELCQNISDSLNEAETLNSTALNLIEVQIKEAAKELEIVDGEIAELRDSLRELELENSNRHSHQIKSITLIENLIVKKLKFQQEKEERIEIFLLQYEELSGQERNVATEFTRARERIHKFDETTTQTTLSNTSVPKQFIQQQDGTGRNLVAAGPLCVNIKEAAIVRDFSRVILSLLTKAAQYKPKKSIVPAGWQADDFYRVLPYVSELAKKAELIASTNPSSSVKNGLGGGGKGKIGGGSNNHHLSQRVMETTYKETAQKTIDPEGLYTHNIKKGSSKKTGISKSSLTAVTGEHNTSNSVFKTTAPTTKRLGVPKPTPPAPRKIE